MNLDVEIVFASKFVEASAKRRVCYKLKSRKRRKFVHDSLPHCSFFDRKFRVDIPKANQNPDYIFDALIKFNSPEKCYLMSSDPVLDGKEMLLRDALDSVVGQLLGGTVIICIPDKLAYFEGEEHGDRYILFDSRSQCFRRQIRYLTVDGMLSGTGLRDSTSGGFIEPSSLGLSKPTMNRISSWLKSYEEAHYRDFSNLDQVEELDCEGIEICRLLQDEVPECKVDYFSHAKCIRVNSHFIRNETNEN